MSRGWVPGSKEFKAALVDDPKRETAARVLAGDAGTEAKEVLWEQRLDECIQELGHTGGDARSAHVLRVAARRRARWIGDRLNMGPEAGISRCLC